MRAAFNNANMFWQSSSETLTASGISETRCQCTATSTCATSFPEKPHDMQSVGYREAALKIRLLWLLGLINVAVRIVSCTEGMRGDVPPMTIDDAVFHEY